MFGPRSGPDSASSELTARPMLEHSWAAVEHEHQHESIMYPKVRPKHRVLQPPSSSESASYEEHVGQSKIAHMVKRCRLQQAYHQWCIAFAATSQWTHVTPAFKVLLERTFSGWTQTRVNEKANKVLRDSQNRESSSKVNHIMYFQTLTFV